MAPQPGTSTTMADSDYEALLQLATMLPCDNNKGKIVSKQGLQHAFHRFICVACITGCFQAITRQRGCGVLDIVNATVQTMFLYISRALYKAVVVSHDAGNFCFSVLLCHWLHYYMLHLIKIDRYHTATRLVANRLLRELFDYKVNEVRPPSSSAWLRRWQG